METLEEIKDRIAQEHGYANSMDVFEFTYALCDEVAKRYAQSACEDLRERIAEKAIVKGQKGDRIEFLKVIYPHTDGWKVEADKDSIRNVEIILK